LKNKAPHLQGAFELDWILLNCEMADIELFTLLSAMAAWYAMLFLNIPLNYTNSLHPSLNLAHAYDRH